MLIAMIPHSIERLIISKNLLFVPSLRNDGRRFCLSLGEPSGNERFRNSILQFDVELIDIPAALASKGGCPYYFIESYEIIFSNTICWVEMDDEHLRVLSEAQAVFTLESIGR